MKSPSFFRLLLLFPVLIASCTGQAPTEAITPIPDSTMIQLLIELHLAEARAQTLQTDTASLRDSIFLFYDIEPDAFEAAMEYYTQHPENYLKIYSEALDKLSDERYMPSGSGVGGPGSGVN